jgi:hypothetical protein
MMREDLMAIIRIPDDDVIEKLVTRRSFLRDVGPINGTWIDEPIIGESPSVPSQAAKFNS